MTCALVELETRTHIRKLADTAERSRKPGRSRTNASARLAEAAIGAILANYYTNKLNFLEGLVAAFAIRAASMRVPHRKKFLQTLVLLMASHTAEVTSRVVALPPRSGVWTPEAVTRSTACISRRAASFSPRWSSIREAVQKAPMGLAMPLPVMSKAAPWMGSNMEGKRRSGSRLAVGAIPRLPARAAARSERMSA